MPDSAKKVHPTMKLGQESADQGAGTEMLTVVPKLRRELVEENNHLINKVRAEDRVVHDWYRFVLAFPPHLIRHYLQKLGADPDRDVVLDPFVGCGTTSVEAKKLGFEGYATEANPVGCLATKVKTTWDLIPARLTAFLESILRDAKRGYKRAGFDDEDLFFRSDAEEEERDEALILTGLTKEQEQLIPEGFISPVPLAKFLILLKAIDHVVPELSNPDVPSARYRDLFRLAAGAVLVEGIGNLGFGPEVYRTAPKKDAPVVVLFERKARKMIEDLALVRQQHPASPFTCVLTSDAREMEGIPDNTIDVVITSPPYPNEKDYTRSTRLESVLLHLIKDKTALRGTKELLVRSNTRTIFKGDDDDKYIQHISSIIRVADQIEKKRQELQKTSGFERLYHRVVRLYFGGMYRHLTALKRKLRSGARCAYVVGDQMSFFQIPIRTGQLLAEVADDLGFQVTDIDLWRERRSTATRLSLREEVVLLRKP
jgi:DNA modification methylase